MCLFVFNLLVEVFESLDVKSFLVVNFDRFLNKLEKILIFCLWKGYRSSFH